MDKLRVPAAPLITVDPYFNTWSFADKLYDDTPRHWTGAQNTMTGILVIDGVERRFMGKINPDSARYYTEPDPIEQKSLSVNPLTTHYRFECESVGLTLEFMTPLLPQNLMLLSRPISYISYSLESRDALEHDITLYLDFGPGFVTNDDSQAVHYFETEYSYAISSGTHRMLKTSGDDRRIDWGTLHVIAPGFECGVISQADKKLRFCPGRKKPYSTLPLGTVATPAELGASLYIQKNIRLTPDITTGFICVGYDDVKSIDYFGSQIEAYWRKDGAQFKDVAALAVSEYDKIKKDCAAFEGELMAKARKISDKYCDIVSLAYRQVIAAHKLTYADGKIQFFSKENFSNGCIGTVDITYPSIPLFLIYNPELIKGMLNPIFKMVSTTAWPYPFAPHDVGTYPLATGQVYGYKRLDSTKPDPLYKQMPVEECGNVLLCVAALCRAEGSYDYAKEHIEILNKWADYLVEVGYDPAEQLCTDDFAGHLAHNTNLSVKAIVALGAWAACLEKLGLNEKAVSYRKTAEQFAALWEKAAFAGDHYSLTFNNPDSFSIKYNMVWDTLLGLGLFNESIKRTEVDYYMTRFNRYGLPLDSRNDYTKSDWQMWATRLCDSPLFLEKVVESMWEFLHHGRDRVPFTDWYYTSSPYMCTFQNRSVQGGLFINLLDLS